VPPLRPDLCPCPSLTSVVEEEVEVETPSLSQLVVEEVEEEEDSSPEASNCS